MATEKCLIDANVLIESLENIAKNTVENFTVIATTLYSAIDVVKVQKPVDALEVVHGRWEKTEYHGFLRCSECKDAYVADEWVEDGKWNYCPNCGAKMDGERNQE